MSGRYRRSYVHAGHARKGCFWLPCPTCVEMHAEYLVPCTKGRLKAIVAQDALSQSIHSNQRKRPSKAFSVGVLRSRKKRNNLKVYSANFAQFGGFFQGLNRIHLARFLKHLGVLHSHAIALLFSLLLPLQSPSMFTYLLSTILLPRRAMIRTLLEPSDAAGVGFHET